MKLIKFISVYMENFKNHLMMEMDFSRDELILLTGGNGCLVGDTEIDVPRDLIKDPYGPKIKDLVGKEFFTYCYDLINKKLELKLAKNVRKTGIKKEVWKVTYKGNPRKGFKDYESIIGTPDHPILLSNGEYKAIRDLKLNDSIMSFYRRTYDDYTHIRPTIGDEVYEHKFVSEKINGESEISHHIDHNKFNNSINNLQPMNKKEHTSYHTKKRGLYGKDIWKDGNHPKGFLGKKRTKEWKKKNSEYQKSRCLDLEHKSKIMKPLIKYAEERVKDKLYTDKNWLIEQYVIQKKSLRDISKEFNFTEAIISYWLNKCNIEKRSFSEVQKLAFEKNNHKVISVEFYGYEDVYDMEVEDCHNFVANGIFVHNSGKSSIIDALLYALFDETANSNKADSVVNKKIGKNCFVLLKFMVNDDLYEIHRYRKHKKNANAKYLLKNGKDISGAEIKDTNKLIEQIVMKKDIFFNCMLFSQLTNKPFISMTHSEQKEILDNILSLSVYDEYLAKVDAEIKMIKENSQSTINKNHELSGRYETLSSVLKSEEESLEKLNKITKVKKDELVEKIKELNNSLKSIEFSKDEYDNQLKEKEELSSFIKICEERIKNQREQYKVELINLKVSLEHQNNLELQNESKDLILEKESLNKQKLVITNNTNKVKDVKLKYKSDLLKEWNEKIADLKSEYNKQCLQYKVLIQSIEGTIKELINERTYIEENIKRCLQKYNDIKEKFEAEDSKCHTCNQSLKTQISIEKIQDQIIEYEGVIKDYREQVIDKQKVLSKEQENLNGYKTNLKDYEDKYKLDLSGLDDYDINIQQINEDISNIEDKLNLEISEIENRIEKIDKIILTSETKIKEKFNTTLKSSQEELINKHKIIASEWTKEIESCEGKKLILEDNIEKSTVVRNYIEKVVSDIKNDHKELEYLKNNFIVNSTSIEKNITNYKDQINIIIDEKEKIKSDVDGVNEKLEILNFWKTAFGNTGIKNLILDEAIPILNAKAIELSNMTNNIRVRFTSQQLIKSGDVRNKFNINVLNTKNLSEIDEFSAGEKRLSNIIVLLCLRNLLEVMSNTRINLLLLDEILDSLDEENSNISINMIKNNFRDYCILLISHTLKPYIFADKEYIL